MSNCLKRCIPDSFLLLKQETRIIRGSFGMLQPKPAAVLECGDGFLNKPGYAFN